jgi:hypothetical protein
MGLMRFLLIVILGYLLWRIVRLVFRMLQGPSRGQDGVIQPPEGQQPTKPFYTDVKDAQYEDLPPSEQPDDTSTP